MIRRLDTWRSVLIMALLLLGMVAATESRPSLMREDLNFVHPLEYGTALNEVTLQAAVGAIGSDEKILLLTPGRWIISSDLTIPLNVTMLVSAGATLEVTGGSTLTINGQLDAPPRPLFHGTGTVVLGPRIGERRAEWWGVVCDGATDSTAGLQAFVRQGGDLELPRGTCRFTRRLDISTNVGGLQLRGHGTILSYVGPAASDALTVSAHHATLENFEIHGNHVARDGLVFVGAALNRVHSVVVTGCTRDGVVFDTSRLGGAGNNNSIHLDTVWATSNGRHGVASPEHQVDNNAIVLTNVVATANAGHGLLLKGDSWVIEGGDFEGNAGCGIKVGEASDGPYSYDSLLLLPWLEGNKGGGLCHSGKSAGSTSFRGRWHQGASFEAGASGSELTMETDFTGQVNVSQGILKCRRPWAEFQPYSQNGMSCYCTDCTRTPSCGSGGTGAWAFRDAGVWKCNVVR